MKWSRTTDLSLLVLNWLSYERPWRQTYNIQYLPPTRKWTSRMNCTDCQTLVVESERPIQSAAWLHKESSWLWTLSCKPFLRRRLKTTPPTAATLLQPGHGSSKEHHSDMVNRQEREWEPVNISSRWSSHNEVRWYLQEIRGGDSDLFSLLKVLLRVLQTK